MGKWAPQYENQQPESARQHPRRTHAVEVLCDRRKGAHLLVLAYRDPDADDALVWHYFDVGHTEDGLLGRGGSETLRAPGGSRWSVRCPCLDAPVKVDGDALAGLLARWEPDRRRVVLARLSDVLLP